MIEPLEYFTGTSAERKPNDSDWVLVAKINEIIDHLNQENDK